MKSFFKNIHHTTKLTDKHSCKVLVSYYTHDVGKLIMSRIDGTYLSKALSGSNKRLAFPVTAEYHNRQQLIKEMRKRSEEKINDG
ncbi:MAG: hypothetical protein ACTXOO_01780 [Sodalis sp. (in: enterobacteria)]